MDAEPYTGPDTERPAAHRADAQAVLPRLRRDQVYQELRRRIMVGEFALNSRLIEERLAALLGVSRTPVREALVRLLADGQLTRVDGGYFVATPDFSDLRDLASRKYNANWVGSFAGNDNPLTLASFGSSVTLDLQSKITTEQTARNKPGASVFTGPTPARMAAHWCRPVRL